MQDAAAARLTVDLDALAANYATLRAEAHGAEVAPVVKADAYGLGAAAVARRLHAEGARRFFVARLSEGEALRASLEARAAEIYVLDGCPHDSAARLLAARLTPVLNSLDQIETWRNAAPREGLAAALHVDTGMNRLGVTLDQAQALDAASDRLQRVEVSMVMSHLACATTPEKAMNGSQLARFRETRALFPAARASLASSAGIFLGAEYAFDMVRPGISLYGGGPFERPDPRLRAVATFDAPILQVRDVGRGETVGYGASFVADRAMRVAVIAAGYADGVLRGASGRGYGVVNGRSLPFLGRVSMDLIAMDVTDHPSARAGERVQLVGPQAPLDEAASNAGTIAYELLVRLGERSRSRAYLGEVA